MKKILVVDDSSTVRMYHKKILSGMGFHVDEAVNGLEALEKSLLEHYDAFVVDINMPKMDGYRFVTELRAQPENANTPVVMVSTESEEQDKDKAFAAGATSYLIKPTKPVELNAFIKMVLEDKTNEQN